MRRRRSPRLLAALLGALVLFPGNDSRGDDEKVRLTFHLLIREITFEGRGEPVDIPEELEDLESQLKPLGYRTYSLSRKAVFDGDIPPKKALSHDLPGAHRLELNPECVEKKRLLLHVRLLKKKKPKEGEEEKEEQLLKMGLRMPHGSSYLIRHEAIRGYCIAVTGKFKKKKNER